MAGSFRKAERRKARLRLGITGPAGAGKTASSLLIAYGLAGSWEKVGLVDTENGSGELYAGGRIGGTEVGSYQVLTLFPPYEPEKYIQAIRAAEDAGLEVVILDSISHAWSGEGGLLDLHGRIASQGKNNSYTAWRFVTPKHNAFVEAMLGSRIHVIATMRSRMEYVVEKDAKGETTVRRVGLAPVQRDGMEYEFTLVLDLSGEHVAAASKDRTGLFDGQYFVPGPDTGRKLREWLESAPGTPVPKEEGLGEPRRSEPQAGPELGAGPREKQREHLRPVASVMKAYSLDPSQVKTVARELTGKDRPDQLTAGEAQEVARVLEKMAAEGLAAKAGHAGASGPAAGR